MKRRFAAMFYDVLLLLSIWLFATWILLPFSGGEAISSENLLYPVYLYIIAFLYFDWQWRHGGQTLGMRAWHIQLVAVNDAGITLHMSVQRFLLATISLLFLGLGFLHAYRDINSLTLHDRFSGTFPVKIM